MKVLAFGGSNSKNSINKKFAKYAAHQLKGAEVNLIDINDYEMPLYGIDKENEIGIPQLAHDFKTQIEECDVIVLSLAEHNGAYSTAFKNLFDWVSRVENDIWRDKPMFLMATSPGGRGGATVLEIASAKFGRMNKTPLTTFSLPGFYDNFDEANGISDPELAAKFRDAIAEFENIIKGIEA